MQANKSRELLEKEVSSNQVALDDMDDTDLQKLWDQAGKDFFDKTGISLKDRNGQEKAENGFQAHVSVAVNQIFGGGSDKDAVADPEGHHNTRTTEKFKSILTKPKKIFKGVFRVIWKLHAFLEAMASSIPFAGAGVTLVVKSIELLIETTEKYREIFDSAAVMFHEVGFFSMRFDMVMEAQKAGAAVHPKFVKFLNIILKHVVDCVALYVKTFLDAGKSEGFKNVAEVTKMFF
ncbi:hypothetical protein COCVIDRAFT_21733 [Bipolaris victoriae FI3]|uniref:Uncharacterized protein n=1 Tax=Bipolaris victoriae (strain FI3) TaxID=930091 RepID=W7EX57_BIPV3|nr:hypothetical protein COCVIDRAFT_21733 [Bipolaris victoriae FI3]